MKRLIVATSLSLLLLPLFACADWRKVTDGVKNEVETMQPPLGPHQLSIDYHSGGSITLNGRVDSARDRERIERAARTVEGVTSVENLLDVKPVPSDLAVKVDDAELRDDLARVSKAIHPILAQVDNAVVVTATDGSIILSGGIDGEAPRQRILSAARGATNRSIVDKLTMLAPPSDADLAADVTRAIRESHPDIASKIMVEADRGNVLLKGDLRDHWQIDRVLASAQMVQGVRIVESKMTIDGHPYNSGGRVAAKPE